MPDASLLTLLQEHAIANPDTEAFTFTDYDVDPNGVSQTLTWAQVHRRTVNAAHEFEQYGSPGDRALIIAPQGLDYIVAFLGAMQAGFIAVPLSVPVPGSHDERVSAVVADTSPVVVLTTSAVAHLASQYVDDGAAMIAVVSVDSLDLDRPVAGNAEPAQGSDVAYLQYTSGSTRLPAGVMISHRNLQANYEQLMADYFAQHGGVLPEGTKLISWLPFYHDMGLMLGVAAPIFAGHAADLMSPLAFLANPMRWVRALSRPTYAWSAAPNFAFDFTARRASDADMSDLDLSGILGIINGAERIHPPTLVKFNERFSAVGFRPEMMVPSYGLAEATVFVASGNSGRAPEAVEFAAEDLVEGVATRSPGGSPLMRYGMPVSPLVRIVDADTCRPCPDGTIGEIWTHGENVSAGYWCKPEQTGSAFGATLADAPADAPETGWLRTGDRGFISEGDLFIVGRIKDMLIVRGRNYYPEDIEATVQQITRGRVAAIAVPDEQTENLVIIIELKKTGDTRDLDDTKSKIIASISRAHGLHVADIVFVAPGDIPTTTSGKIRRSGCVENYRVNTFQRLDN
ncbi:AMP-binding protein [Mycolicibacterium sp. 120266]|uniref:AMP-binding protein n=1 Tax=Mycolicibacterium sp. 120266 TaxID=3090601 RepID=UPI00299E806A|nr:AMP-binding protein [Mycolicibacterium sp. 120266]MDX1872149.1 AMP-binding protein [Mycolicibacterium sp. 120266]